MAKQRKICLLIDESGDPVFYGNRKKLLVGQQGYQPYLIIGIVETHNRRSLHKAVKKFIERIRKDTLYNSIYSVIDKDWYVHASRDHVEIRAKFFEMIRNLKGFKAHAVIARKDINIFNKKHNNSPSEFYFDVLHHLLKTVMHDDTCHYTLILAQHRNSSFPEFKKAVRKALMANNNQDKVIYDLQIAPSKESAELSIVDYILWAVQRSLLAGENRHFDALKDKFASIIKLYFDDKKI